MEKIMARLFVALNVLVYRLSSGKIMGKAPGHGSPVFLLTTKGRKSGKTRTVALIYLADGQDLVVVASLAGAPRHPAWFFNLEADPKAVAEIGSRRFPVTARRASAEEKAKYWARLVAIYPPYEDYQKKTSRDIPVVVLTPA